MDGDDDVGDNCWHVLFRSEKDSKTVKDSFCETRSHTHCAFKYYLHSTCPSAIRLKWLIRTVPYRTIFCLANFAVIISFRLLVNDTCLCLASLTDMCIAIISILSDYSFDFYRL
uniref:Uncharacterized protein n=1 Tax=Glossina palpalis gambiensis TaxID=67801 RepID=A0A1B0AMS9_9MUSC